MSFELIGKLSPTIDKIDQMQARTNELKAANPDAYDKIMDAWAVESTYNSNNIEGSTLSLGDTALLYAGVHVGAPTDDIRQAEGGFAALDFLRKAVSEGSTLSESLVKRAHELLFAEAKDPLMRGAYRAVEVEITGTTFQPTPAIYVQERMGQLISSCTRSKRHPAIIAALFHLEFESIHPFVNANGRTGRLISNYILMSSGYEPVNIQAESRARYISTLRAFQMEDDPLPFVAFFCENLLDRLIKIEAQLSGAGTLINKQRRSAFEAFAYEVDALDRTAAQEAMPPTDQVNAFRPLAGDQVTDQVARLLAALGEEEKSASEIMVSLGLRHKPSFRESYLRPALDLGLIEMTVPDKPRSSAQKYRRTR